MSQKTLIIQSADIVFICATDIKSGQHSIYITVLQTRAFVLLLVVTNVQFPPYSTLPQTSEIP